MKLFIIAVSGLCKVGLSEDPAAEAVELGKMHGVADPDKWESAELADPEQALQTARSALSGAAQSGGFFDVAFGEAVRAVEDAL